MKIIILTLFALHAITLAKPTHRPVCVDTGCTCVPEEQANGYVRCPVYFSSCYTRSSCVYRAGRCQYTHSWWINRCLRILRNREQCAIGICGIQCVKESELPGPNDPMPMCAYHPGYPCYRTDASCIKNSSNQCEWSFSSNFDTCWNSASNELFIDRIGSE